MVEVQELPTPELPAALVPRVRALLEAAFDGDFSEQDWEHALGGRHVVVFDEGRLVSHASVVPRAIDIGARTFDAGYVEAVATAPASRRAGHGARAMERIGEVIRRHHEVGVLSTGRHGFYERLGWERWRGPSYVLAEGKRVRTAEEDAGLMVLRFGPSADVTLADRIACRSRPGDDW